MTFALGLWIFAWALTGAPACHGSVPAPTPQPGVDTATVPIWATNSQGQAFYLQAEIPQTPEAMFRGLMGWPSLAEDKGMLFVFGSLRGGFWMKDTLIPLSVAFIAQDGTIVDIQDMEPLSLDVHNTDRPYYYGLEVNRGWFARRGIVAGDRFRFPWPYDAPPRSPFGP